MFFFVTVISYNKLEKNAHKKCRFVDLPLEEIALTAAKT